MYLHYVKNYNYFNGLVTDYEGHVKEMVVGGKGHNMLLTTYIPGLNNWIYTWLEINILRELIPEKEKKNQIQGKYSNFNSSIFIS